jgi:hypothetical protein
MNKPAIPATISAKFVLRFQSETTAGEARWRGSIEHVPSGEIIAFMDFETMLHFLQHFGIWESDPDQVYNSLEVSEQ